MNRHGSLILNITSCQDSGCMHQPMGLLGPCLGKERAIPACQLWALCWAAKDRDIERRM